MVDDYYVNMDRQVSQIQEFLENEGFQIDIQKSNNGDEVLEWLKKKPIDLILADKHLPGRDGKDLIKEIRNNNFTCDILFYSGVKVSDEEILDLARRFISVEIIRGREIVSIVKKMIKKNIAKWDDVIYLRGIALSEAINMEFKINDFFSKYFKIAESTLQHFELVMEGTVSTFEPKRRVLKRIIEFNHWDEFETIPKEIQEVQEMRNTLAHSKFDLDSRSFKNSFTGKSFDANKIKEILKGLDITNQNMENLISKLMAGLVSD